MCLSSFFVTLFHDFKKGIDFGGGLLLELSSVKEKAHKKKQLIQDEITQITGIETIVNSFGSLNNQDNKILFTAKTGIFTQDQNLLSQKIEQIKKKLTQQEITIVKVESVGPQMTKSFIQDAIFAGIFSFIAIFIYILIRFNSIFAIAGIVALMHDTLIALCFINLTKIEFNLTTMTGVLTIIGYCINDKIVIFDRIRSNFTMNSKMNDIIDTSIRQVFTRSILTSVATMIATSSLLFFHDIAIREFGKVVIFGIIIGTYSSITLASNFLLLFKLKKPVIKKKDPMFYAS